MEALFVHGMGRTSLSGWPLLLKLRRAGIKASTFGYAVTVEDFSRIRDRLTARVAAIATRGDYILVGNSLGGVLLRAAVNSLPRNANRPRHVFLLGSPIQPSRLAQRLQRNPAFRIFTRDCGDLLASPDRMLAIGAIPVPTTSIVGTNEFVGTRRSFSGEVNDGLVSVGEASADWVAEQVRVPCGHTFLPSSNHVAEAILQRLRHAGNKVDR